MHYFPTYTMGGVAGLPASILFLALVWTIVLKGFALWYAARGSQKWWFIVMLVVNTLGILEIVYLIWFRPKTDTVDSSTHHAHHHEHRHTHESSDEA